MGPFRRSRKHLAWVALLSLIVASCGGGSSSSDILADPPDGDSASGSTNGAQPGFVDVPDDLSVAGASCAMNLSDVLGSNGTVTVLGDISSQCDYFLDNNLRVTGDIEIAAGVTIAMAPDVNLEFRQGDVTISGTATAPVSFLPSEPGLAWGTVSTSGGNIDIINAIFSGGGAGEPGAVEISGSDSVASIANSLFSDSNTNGLVLGGFDARLIQFSGNTMRGNRGFGLKLESLSVVGGLGSDNDYVGASAANGNAGVLVAANNSRGIHFRNIGTRYYFSPDEGFANDTNVQLNDVLIDAGVLFEFDESVSLTLDDATVNGTVDAPVVFTSDADGLQWGGVELSGTNNVVLHVLIENGGGGQASVGGALRIDSIRSPEDMILENIQIVNAQSWGIFCEPVFQTEPGEITALSIVNTVSGDIHPACDFTIIDNDVPGGVAFNTSTCAQVLIGNMTVLEPFFFMNTDSDCDYLISGDIVFSSNVTIEPGAVLVFTRGASVNVTGSFVATGTAQLPIVLKSEEARDGYWNGVRLGGAVNQMAYVEIEDGGVEGAQGLELHNGLANATITPTFEVTNVTVSGSDGDGLSVSQRVELIAFSDNTFIGNAGVGLRMVVDQLPILDSATLYNSALAPNGKRGIQLFGTSTVNDPRISVRRDEVLEFIDLGEPYRINTVDVAAAGTFRVNAGVEVLVEDGGAIDASFDGILELAGTGAEPVIVQLAEDQSEGWHGIELLGASITASNLTLSGAGTERESPGLRGDPAALLLRSDAAATLDNVQIDNSRGWGISCVNTNPSDFQFTALGYANNFLGNINPTCGS